MLTIITMAILVAAVYVAKEYIRSNSKKYSKKGTWKPPIKQQPNKDFHLDLRDTGQQLKIVSAQNVEFFSKKLMGYGEYHVFNIIEKEIIKDFQYCRLFAQVSLGEILSSKNEMAHKCINSKRVDLLIIDGGGNPLIVIEYQGKGHHNNNAPARDAVKKEALRKADIEYIEITPNHSDDDIKYIISRALESKLKNKKDIKEVSGIQTIQLVK